ncbi:MAG TPA: ESX secretion-associated protein EspG [Pseudonocardiaceae bacterium]
MADRHDPIVLTPTEFEVAWESLRLGDLPLLFRVRVDRHGDTDEDRARLVRETLEGLRGRGLAGDHGLDERLADALALLAAPRWLVDARLDTGRPVHALGAAAGTAAAIAVLADDLVTITTGTAYRLATDMAALAAEHPPGPGSSINLSYETLVRAAEHATDREGEGRADPRRLEEELAELGVPLGEARLLARINQEMIGSGQYGVEVCDPDSGMRRAPRVVGFSDTPEGRWAQLRTAGHGGTQWVTFTPAGRAQLAAMISELAAECGVRAA